MGLMARPLVPKVPLPVLILATQVPDLLFFGFEAAGIEHQAQTEIDTQQGLTYIDKGKMHWSHGLLMNIIWSTLAAAIAFVLKRNRRTSIVIGGLIFSHWLLDFIVYPHLPLTSKDSPKVGLGLLTSGPGLMLGMLLEFALLLVGTVIYLVNRRKHQKD
jgi:hypothetical protein